MAHILVIDDDVEQRTLLRRMLARAGHEVSEAREGGEGITLCQARPMDLVILDMVMPGQDGMDTIPMLRALRPAPKILAISGLWHLGILTIATRLGADQVLAKPLERAALLAAVQALVGAPEDLAS